MAFKKTMLATAVAMTSMTALANTDQWDYPLLGNDPLATEQWHLKNTGQDGFSKSKGVAGNGLNVDFAHAMGIKGRGVTVSVIDSGLQIDHPDLAANVVPGSINLLDGSDYPEDKNGHGTSVGGLIGAVENNGIGGRGVAPFASLIGFNYLSEQSSESWLLSHGVSKDWRKLDRFTDPRVFNQSYGWTPNTPYQYDYSYDPGLELNDTVMQDVSLNSHSGRGAVYIKSAGNSYRRYSTSVGGTRFQVLPYENGQYYNNQGLPFHNSNVSPGNVTYWNTVISALGADGTLSSYSSVGSNVFFSAPGGEYGRNKPAMVTTDLMGCEQGMNITGATNNGLHGGDHPADPNCDYTATMNGTSSAAPNASGAFAVVMQANAGLNARTVRHVLAQTARKTDPENTGVPLSFENANGEVVSYDAVPGWQTNAAGYQFHNFYGLGAINVDEAVYKSWFTTNLPEQVITGWQTELANVEVPDATLEGAESSLVTEENVTIEAVQIKLNLDHERLRDLAIELTSPSGTRSVLMSPRTGFLGANYKNAQLLSTHFYGENSQGEWTIKVIDTDKGSSYTLMWDYGRGLYGRNAANNTVPGVIKDWSIRFIGH